MSRTILCSVDHPDKASLKAAAARRDMSVTVSRTVPSGHMFMASEPPPLAEYADSPITITPYDD